MRRLLRAPAVVLVSALLTAAGCGRRQPLPTVVGSLVGAIVTASLADEEGPAAGPLLLDSVSFSRIGIVARGAPLGAAELRAQYARPFELVDATHVLECPRREPCRVRGDATWIEIWEAVRDGAALELVVSRVYNVQGLHRMTASVTHRLRLVPEAGGWRLAARERLPG